MNTKHAEKIKTIEIEMAELIKNMITSLETREEWDNFAVLVAAHMMIRSLETAKYIPIHPKFGSEYARCPKCGIDIQTVREKDIICSNCGVTVHWQGSVPWCEIDWSKMYYK